MENNYLQHYGVLGMRWGIRRYQNKDGTLTAAGKKRYDKEMEKLKKEERILKNKARTQAKIDKLTAKRRSIEELKGKADKPVKKDDPKPKKKSVSDLTDDELQSVVRRLELEKRFSDLQPKQVSKGKRFVDTILTPTATQITKTLLSEFATKQGKKMLGLTEDDSLKKKVEQLDLEKRYRDLTNKDTYDADLAKMVKRMQLEKSLKDLKKKRDAEKINDIIRRMKK